MIIKDTMDYTMLLQLLQTPMMTYAVNKVTFTKPDLEHEGFNGYIETGVEFEITDLVAFATGYDAVLKQLASNETYSAIRVKLINDLKHT